MIFKNDIFKELKVGDKLDVYIKKIRDDGKLDFSARAIGKDAKTNEAQEAILKELQNAKSLPFTSKSNPEDIKKRFGLSKKSFKSALNSLIESGKIELTDGKIKLLNN
jgi:predicted RNA-binding protein (virulence factor B family)